MSSILGPWVKYNWAINSHKTPASPTCALARKVYPQPSFPFFLFFFGGGGGEEDTGLLHTSGFLIPRQGLSRPGQETRDENS